MKDAFPRLLGVITFRFSRADLEKFGWNDLALGLLFVWLAGVGRYWDDPRGLLLQKLGIGSLVYVFALAALLWIVARPLARTPLPFLRLLVFICYTAPPALLYAIPVEFLLSLKTANIVNLTFLGIVSAWRVALYVRFLRVGSGFSVVRILVATLLPICGIITALAALNLHHVVFDIMGGIRDSHPSVHDASYSALFFLALLSVPTAALAGLGWLGILGWDQYQKYRLRSDGPDRPLE